MFPDLPPLGPLHLHSYGIMLALAFWLGSGLLWRVSARRGWDENNVATFCLVVLVVSVAGARVFFVATHWGEYAADPWGALRIWEGGLTLYGGILAAIPAAILYCRRARLPVWEVGDAVAPALAVGTAVGRAGCFLNGCCFGVPTTLPWGVHFPVHSYAALQFPGYPVHPSQVYAVLGELAVIGALFAARPLLRRPGQLWWLFVMLDAVARYLVDVTRYYEPSAFLGHGLTVSQAISVGLFVLGLAMFAWLGRGPARVTGAADARR
ncbi:MAG: prolipoprotein diacylglyceryl transferase [Candidatus Eisenbacteria bacterium]|nr:prolipoprotein diacylglyceryl transferase [Candidatus Eisenbacteria bacterium]